MVPEDEVGDRAVAMVRAIVQILDGRLAMNRANATAMDDEIRRARIEGRAQGYAIAIADVVRVATDMGFNPA